MPKLTKEQLDQIQDYLQTLPEEQREPKLKEIFKQYEDQPAQCPFCLMSEGKIETTKIYEDDDFLVVLEINPTNQGHALLMTKRHIKKFSELSEKEATNLGKILKKLGVALSKTSEGLNFVYCENQIAGQRFDHFTVNLLPRAGNDNISISWQGKQSKKEDLEKTKKIIVENIPKEEPPKPKEPINLDQLKEKLNKGKKILP